MVIDAEREAMRREPTSTVAVLRARPNSWGGRPDTHRVKGDPEVLTPDHAMRIHEKGMCEPSLDNLLDGFLRPVNCL